MARDHIRKNPVSITLLERAVGKKTANKVVKKNPGLFKKSGTADVSDLVSTLDLGNAETLFKMMAEFPTKKDYIDQFVGSTDDIKNIEKDGEKVYKDSSVYKLHKKLKREPLFFGEIVAVMGQEAADSIIKNNRNAVALSRTRTPDQAAIDNGYEEPISMMVDLGDAQTKKEFSKEFVENKVKEFDANYQPEEFLMEMDEVSEALNFLRMKSLEYTSLEDRANRKDNSVKYSKQVIKRLARKRLMGMEVKDIRPSKFLAEYRAAMREHKRSIITKSTKVGKPGVEEKADLGVSDPRRAYRAMTKAQVSYEMWRESIKMKKQIDKTKRKLNKAIKTSPAIINENYLENLKLMAVQYGFVKKDSIKDIDAVILAENPLYKLLAPENDPVLDVGPVFSDFFLHNNDFTDYKGMKFHMFEELLELLDFLNEKGRAVNKDEIAHAKMERQDLVNMMAEQVAPLKNRVGYFLPKQSYMGRIMKFSEKFLAALGMPQFWFLRLDGGNTDGLFTKMIWEPLTKAQDLKYSLLEEVVKSTKPALDHFLNKIKNAPQFLTDIQVPVPELMRANNQPLWTMEQVITMALNMGNKYNLQAIMDGYAMSEQDVWGVVGQLSDADWKYIQQIWDAIESQYGMLSTEFKKVNFVKPGKVEAEPLELQSGLVLRGGYYPLKFDPELDTKTAGRNETEDLLNSNNAAFYKAAAPSGHTKQRKGTGGLPVALNLGVLSKHLDFSTSYIAFAKLAQDLNRLLNHADFIQMFKDKVGPEAFKTINKWLRHTVRQDGDVLGIMDSTFRYFKGKTTAYILGANPSVAAKQPFSLGGFINDRGFKTFFDGIKTVLANPRESYEMVVELSPTMRARFENIFQEFKEVVNRFKPGESENLKKLQGAMFFPILMMDAVAVIPAWIGAYHQGMTKYSGDIQEAVNYANESVSLSQPSSRPMDLSDLQRDKTGLSAIMSMFGTFTLKYGNRQRLLYSRLRDGTISTPEFMRGLVLEAIVPPMLMTFAISMLQGKDNEPEDYFWDVLLYQAVGLPVVREFAVFLANQLRGERRRGLFSTPIETATGIFERFIGMSVDMAKNLDSDESQEKFMWAFYDLASFFAGVPASRVSKKMSEGYRQWQEEDGTIRNMLFPNPDKRKRR